MNDNGKQNDKQEREPTPHQEAGVSADSSISPVEEFEVDQGEENRRIFQNGDTDRTSGDD